MKEILKFISILILIVGVALIVVYFVVIYQMGHNFVHDKPASPEYYDHIANRIGFITKYRGDKFNILLDSFIKNNPQYSLPDTINSLPENDSCNCNCFPFRKYIYFSNSPEEAYLISYDHDTMYATGAGVLDIVFSFRNNEWSCTKSSKFDSAEKSRIETRFDTAILQKIR